MKVFLKMVHSNLIDKSILIKKFNLLIVFIISANILNLAKSEMIFELKLVEYKNPSSKTYQNEQCGPLKNSENCNTGFLFCLVDLPFRNPQNCSLGDFTTPVLGTSSSIHFENLENFTYKFLIKKLPLVNNIDNN